MKNRFRKPLSLLLCAALLCGTVLPAAAAVLGDPLTAAGTLLNEQTQLSTNVFWSTSSSDFQTENLVTYYPNDSVTPMVTYGSVVTEKTTVSAAARELEAQGYRVVAGLNGDFYTVSSGVPVGLVITQGQLRSSDGGFNAIGFRADGTALLGQPGIFTDVYVSAGTEESQDSFRPVGLNKGRTNDGVFLYTYDFNANHTTGTTQPGVDVICTIQEGSLAVGQTLTAVVDQVIEADRPTSLNPDQIVLTANLEADAGLLERLRAILPGASVTLTTSAQAPGWEEVQYAIGGLYALVENGAAVPGLDNAANPRTAVGQRDDGSLIFYTIDGRRSGHSIGASMTLLARRMIELGCVTAFCMDGGGSTTISVTEPDQLSAKTINTPSDGAERAVSNHIFLVADSTPSGELDHFYVTADHTDVLAGSRVRISASAVDTNYIPMTGVPYTLYADGGELEDHILTTPSQGGTVTVTAERQDKTGTIQIRAVDTPDSLSISRDGMAVDALSVLPGAVTRLTASASYQHTPLYADPEAFTWTVEGDIGEVDQQGLFTAGEGGEGTITLSAGGRHVTIPVTVSGLTFQTVEDFEGETTIFRGTGTNLHYNLTSAADEVRMGRFAGRLEYEFSQETGAVAEWRAAKPSAVVSAPYTALTMWVRGDGSGCELSLLIRDNGGESSLDLGAVDFTGWRQLILPLPQTGEITLLGLRLTAPDAETLPGLSGTLCIDHIAASYDGAADTEAPEITLSPELTLLTAMISDQKDGMLPQSSVSVTWDGAEQTFAYDAYSGVLTVPIVSDGRPHRLTVTARDASGNLGRASYDVPVSLDWQPAFSDITADYWAAAFVDYLSAAGVTNGYADGTFRPDQNVTRAQFAAMLCRYLGLESQETEEEIVLPFADAEEIPAYACAAVAALHARGIINGNTGADGRLYFYPGSSLSRAQAAAMIGRTQEKGYASVDLTFSDAADIPAYAAGYIQTMAAQGILGGYADGTFRPNNSITRGQMAKVLYTLM